MGCVYHVQNRINGKSYVGKTATTLLRRRKEHFVHARKGSSYLFHCALREFGFQSFSWKVILESQDLEELKLCEMESIERFSAMNPDGYNMTEGGDGKYTKITKLANARTKYREHKRKKIRTKERTIERLKNKSRIDAKSRGNLR